MNVEPFKQINAGFGRVFQAGRLTLGLTVPIEAYPDTTAPTMYRHVERVQLCEQLGFKAVWVRDVPFEVPHFGDAGQGYDPFTYLGFLTAHTDSIGLGAASIALPLRHPVHVAKSAATVDQLSQGRLLLGVASGDRREEYPAMNINYGVRGEVFRESFDYIREAAKPFPTFSSSYLGSIAGDIDILPVPYEEKLPLIVTGNSRQSLEWIAENGDAWMSYPRPYEQQRRLISQWRSHIPSAHGPKPFMQPLYVDLLPSATASPQPLHLGYSTGSKWLIRHLRELESIGVNHVAINLRWNKADIEKTLRSLAQDVLPEFHDNAPATTAGDGDAAGSAAGDADAQKVDATVQKGEDNSKAKGQNG